MWVPWKVCTQEYLAWVVDGFLIFLKEFFELSKETGSWISVNVKFQRLWPDHMSWIATIFPFTFGEPLKMSKPEMEIWALMLRRNCRPRADPANRETPKRTEILITYKVHYISTLSTTNGLNPMSWTTVWTRFFSFQPFELWMCNV